jgi:hypothetical protein
MRQVPVWLPVSLALLVAGCADPNPTFVFDAAPAAREGGAAGAGGSAVEAGAPEAGNDTDAGADASGDGT